MTVSVAGNLLLTGEYLVTLPGGRGVAVAVEPRAVASAEPAEDWSFEAVMGNERIRWSPGSQSVLPLAQCLLDAAESILPVSGYRLPRGLSLHVDTNAFFRKTGGKAGFGSSAAAAVAMALLMCRCAAVDSNRITPVALSIALKGHRSMQGGRGSGYDIYTSMHGGLGIFTGGEVPSWKPLDSSCLPKASILFGSNPVSSTGAVDSFRKTRLENPGKVEDLLAAMSGAANKIGELCKGGGGESVHPAFISALMDARDCGIRLGSLIGVSALMEHLPKRGFMKALGAGNEIGLAIPPLPFSRADDASIPLVLSGSPRWS